MVAVGPARWAMRVLLLSFILSPQFCTKAGYPGRCGSCQPLIRNKLTAIDESLATRFREGHADHAVACDERNGAEFGERELLVKREKHLLRQGVLAPDPSVEREINCRKLPLHGSE